MFGSRNEINIYIFKSVSINLEYVKVKCTLVQALRLWTGGTAHRGSRGIALLFHDHGTRRGCRVSVTPRPLFTLRNDPVPFVLEAGWPQGRSGQVRKISPPPEFDPRTVQPIASHYTDWATRPTSLDYVMSLKYMHIFSYNLLHMMYSKDSSKNT